MSPQESSAAPSSGSRPVGGTLATFAGVFTPSVGNELIGLYLRYAALATVYGAVGSLVLTVTWVYYSSLAFLFGAELTRTLGERRFRSDDRVRPTKARAHRE